MESPEARGKNRSGDKTFKSSGRPRTLNIVCYRSWNHQKIMQMIVRPKKDTNLLKALERQKLCAIGHGTARKSWKKSQRRQNIHLFPSPGMAKIMCHRSWNGKKIVKTI